MNVTQALTCVKHWEIALESVRSNIPSLAQVVAGGPLAGQLVVTPFPDWVPTEVLQAAQKLTEKEAASQLAVVLSLSS